MATLVLTIIGNDRSGLVDALSGAIVRHGGNWHRSHLAQLAGKFAGIVVVTVPDASSPALVADLEPLKEQGLLDVTAEVAPGAVPGEDDGAPGSRLALHLVGHDRPGIVHEVSHALAHHGVSIEELQTTTLSAPMSAELLFEAEAVLVVPAEVTRQAIRGSLEALAAELMVDIDLGEDAPA